MKCLILLGLTAAVLVVGGCGKPVPSVLPEPTPDPNATKIGFFAPLSGGQRSFGEEALAGAELAVEEINRAGGVLGHPVRLIVRDTQSRDDETAVVVRDLLENEGVAVLIGEVASDRSLVAAPLAQQAGVPMITPGSTNPQVTEVGDKIFRVCFTDEFQGRVMARFARSIAVARAAILYDPSSEYSRGLAESFLEDFLSHGGQLVARETYSTGTGNFSGQLNAIKAADPEIIYLPGYFTDAAAIIREARTLGIDAPFLGTDGWHSPDFLAVGGEAVDNCYFTTHFTHETNDKSVLDFTEAYSKRFQAAPPPLAALAHDAVLLAVRAIGQANSTEAAAITSALAATEDFRGVTGTISIPPSRNPEKSAMILRVADGAFNYVETILPNPLPAP